MKPHASLQSGGAPMGWIGTLVVAVGLAAQGGCAWNKSSEQVAASLNETQPADQAAVVISDATAATAEATPAKATPAQPLTPVDDPQFAAIRAELEQLGALDAEHSAQLSQDLKSVDPSTWPILLQYFRASLAMRKRADAPQPNSDLAGPQGPPPVRREVGRASLASYNTPASMVRLPNAADVLNPGSTQRLPEVLMAAAQADLQNQQQAVTPPAVASTTTPPDALTWKQHLEAAAQALDASHPDAPRTEAEVQAQVFLRLMQLMNGQREQALAPVDGIPPTQKQFWSNQIYALATLLDQNNPNALQQATEATRYLRMAAADLAHQGALEIRNVRFCTKVSSFGVYDTFDEYTFKPQQQLLLYAEVDNFVSMPHQDGYKTSLRVSYQITDDLKRQVVEQELPVLEEVCENRRRDFFILYRIELPERIYDGKHQLLLSIEDTQGRKFGTAPPVAFAVSSK